jgi:hypothetical protein
VHDFVHEATHEFLHLDGKIVRTMKLLIAKPGMLTNEFLIGRRQRYISPLRVYLTCSLLFFLLAAIMPGEKLKVTRTAARPAATETEIEKRVVRGLDQAERDPEQLRAAVRHNLPRVMFVLMPLFALLTWAFYRRQQPFYIPHLYYSVHFHAFVFLVAAVYVVLSRFTYKPAAAALLLLAPMPYHFIALRRVFGGSRAMTFAKGVAVGILYWIAAIAALMAITFWVLLHL